MELHPALSQSIFSEQLFHIAPAPTVIVNQQWEKIGDAEKILLSKILGALRHSFDSVTIRHQPSLDLSQWANKPKYVIYFGEPVKGLPPYEAVEADGVSIVTSKSLSALLQNDDDRKKLWQALKKQFSV